MRSELKDLIGTRNLYSATFERFGSLPAKRKSANTNRKTALVKDIFCEGKLVSDHLWIAECSDFERLRLKSGETVLFTAIASYYVKGYLGFRMDAVGHPISIDVELTMISDVRRKPATLEELSDKFGIYKEKRVHKDVT